MINMTVMNAEIQFLSVCDFTFVGYMYISAVNRFKNHIFHTN